MNWLNLLPYFSLKIYKYILGARFPLIFNFVYTHEHPAIYLLTLYPSWNSCFTTPIEWIPTSYSISALEKTLSLNMYIFIII